MVWSLSARAAMQMAMNADTQPVLESADRSYDALLQRV